MRFDLLVWQGLQPASKKEVRLCLVNEVCVIRVISREFCLSAVLALLFSASHIGSSGVKHWNINPKHFFYRLHYSPVKRRSIVYFSRWCSNIEQLY